MNLCIYLSTNIKSYNEKISTNFCTDKTLKEDSCYIRLSLQFINSVLEQVKTIILKYF